MRNQLSSQLDNAISLLLFAVAGLTPLIFLNQTTEFFEMPKLAFLVAATLVLLGLWIFSWIAKGKIVITRTPLDFPLLVLLAVVIASTYFSPSIYPAIYGNFPRVHGSAVAWITYILLYFVTVSNLKTLGRVKAFLYVLYGSATLVSLISILSFFGLFMPFDFAKAVNFTPTGSSFSTVAFLLLMLPLPLLSVSNRNKYLPAPLAMFLSILFGVTIVLVGTIPSYVALLIAFALCLVAPRANRAKKTLAASLAPLGAVALVLVLAYLPLPGPLGKLQQLEANFPKEIQLPFATSWKVAASAFRDAPFVGTGPSSFLFNFSSYKPVEFNQLAFWNFSFDTAYNEFLQILGTLGILGFAAIALFCLVLLNNSRKNLSLDSEDAQADSVHVLVPSLAVSGLLSVVLLFIHASTLVSTVTTFFVLSALMISQKNIRERIMELSMGLKASTSNRQFDLLPVIIFAVFLVAAVPVAYELFNAVGADYYHRQALAQANKSGTATYQMLQKAEAMNPVIDLYRVDMAQTNFALANAIVARASAQNQASPAAALSDQDKQTIQTLLSQAINEGRVSVALSPRSPRNWEVLASIYRNITGVAQNALAFSLDAYGRAIQRDPLNPTLRLNVGGIYYSVKSYDLAIRFFTDAANLKPDYANAYYNLAIALRDKGDLQNAALVAQQTVTLLQQKNPNSPDYKVATQLLADLKAKVAAGQNANGQANGQAATQGNSALQNANLNDVNVQNLNNPPKVATPAAVKANPNTKLPAISTAPKAPAR